MIRNAIVFSYKDDFKLGDYFDKCAEHATCLLNLKPEIKKIYVQDDNCNFAYVDGRVLPEQNEKSLFVIFSHGNSTGFYKQDDPQPFIDINLDCDVCLDGGLVYTNACSTGEEFGVALPIKNGSYYGYKNPIDKSVPNKKAFIHCDNFGLYRIVQGDTLAEAKRKSIEEFNKYIDKLNMMEASWLRKARDSIVIYGNTSDAFI